MVACADHPGQPIARRHRSESDAGANANARYGCTATGQRDSNTRNDSARFKYSVS